MRNWSQVRNILIHKNDKISCVISQTNRMLTYRACDRTGLWHNGPRTQRAPLENIGPCAYRACGTTDRVTLLWHIEHGVYRHCDITGMLHIGPYFLFVPEGRPGISDAPPVWNLRVVSLIPLFHTSSFVLLPSAVALSVLSFSSFGPLSRLLFPKPPFSER